jgi:hypothetical protein
MIARIWRTEIDETLFAVTAQWKFSYSKKSSSRTGRANQCRATNAAHSSAGAAHGSNTSPARWTPAVAAACPGRGARALLVPERATAPTWYRRLISKIGA